MPTGGPKDQTPPQAIESLPENFSTNFDQKKINIKFDEFIKLTGVNQALIISPSLPEKPKILAKGKNLIIDINNELEDSTTYTFNFGNSIKDITEGNSNEDFRYVFSTGDYLDSLLISGSIINAFDLKTEKDVFILLYNIFEDSIPYLERPTYIAKTNDDGEFTLSNLKSGSYKIFALKDVNSNYIFDMPNEEIAFLDTLIIPNATYFEKIDTIQLDSIRLDSIVVDTLNPDSIRKDSIVDNSYVVYEPREIVLHLFEEEHFDQYIIDSKRDEKASCIFEFNEPNYDSVYIELLNYKLKKENIITQFSKKRDTINYWILDSSVYNIDTLDFFVSYYIIDTLEQKQLITDTITLKYLPPKKKKGEKEIIDTLLSFNTSVKNGQTIGLNKDLILNFSAPLINYDTSKIILYEIVDSLETEIAYTFSQDSINSSNYHIKHKWDETKLYKFVFNAYAFTDLYYRTNDTTQIEFNVEKAETYGTLLLNVKNLNEDVIIQFMNSKNNLINEYYISTEKSIYIDYLKKGKYNVKIIFDSNSNKIWDTGNYLKHLQPEKVMFNTEEISIRSNWDLELELDLQY